MIEARGNIDFGFAQWIFGALGISRGALQRRGAESAEINAEKTFGGWGAWSKVGGDLLLQ